MKRLPIELACYFEYCGVRPEEKWWLALYRVNVRPAAVDDLIRDHRIYCFTVDWPGIDKRRKANRDREEDNPKHGKAKLARPMSWHTHHSAD
jgi:hypothetical protein